MDADTKKLVRALDYFRDRTIMLENEIKQVSINNMRLQSQLKNKIKQINETNNNS